MKYNGEVLQTVKYFCKEIGEPEEIICDTVGEKNLTIKNNSAETLVQP